MFDGPVLERNGDCVGGREVKGLATRDGGAQRAICRFRQPLLLHLVVEDEAAEQFGGLDGRRRSASFGRRPLADALDGF
jgi:hypothetical protein